MRFILSCAAPAHTGSVAISIYTNRKPPVEQTSRQWRSIGFTYVGSFRFIAQPLRDRLTTHTMEQEHPNTGRLPLTNLRDPKQLQPNFDLLSTLFIPPSAPTATPSSGTPLPHVRKHRRLRKLQCSSDDDDDPRDDHCTAAPAQTATARSAAPEVIVLDDPQPRPSHPSSHAAVPSTQAAEVVDLTDCPSPCARPSSECTAQPARAQPFATVPSRPAQVCSWVPGLSACLS